MENNKPNIAEETFLDSGYKDRQKAVIRNVKYSKIVQRVLFDIIRFCLWTISFIVSIPAPMEWLRGIVIESGVDRDLCIYYFRGDLIIMGLYLLNLVVWSLPFVTLSKIWKTLRIDILSLFITVFLLTSSYLIYVEWFS